MLKIAIVTSASLVTKETDGRVEHIVRYSICAECSGAHLILEIPENICILITMFMPLIYYDLYGGFCVLNVTNEWLVMYRTTLLNSGSEESLSLKLKANVNHVGTKLYRFLGA